MDHRGISRTIREDNTSIRSTLLRASTVEDVERKSMTNTHLTMVHNIMVEAPKWLNLVGTSRIQKSQRQVRPREQSYHQQSAPRTAKKGSLNFQGGLHPQDQALLQREMYQQRLADNERDPLSLITGSRALQPERMTKPEHKLPSPALSKENDIPWDQVKYPFNDEELTLPEIEQRLKDNVEGKGKTFHQKVSDSVSKLYEYRQKHAGVGEIKVNFSLPEGIQSHPKEKLREGATYSVRVLEGETRVVDWGAEPANLGTINSLPRLLLAPLKELKDMGEAAPDSVKELLGTKIRGIPLKHWGSYSGLQQKCTEKFENFKKKAEPELRANLERMLEDPQFYETEQRKFITAVMEDISQSFVDNDVDLEDLLEEFDLEYLDTSTEFLLNKSYNMALTKQGWTLGKTLDQLIELLEKANSLIADHNHDSGFSSSSGTDTDSSSDSEGKA
ncbi:MAG: hypothetical protein ACR2PX_26070 [Endozoicomonas sp.]|uniref:hypothetical protein n=1 Tax=Endozoicomonas sp. TaxID=1892382 RepID=UPI003D9B7596